MRNPAVTFIGCLLLFPIKGAAQNEFTWKKALNPDISANMALLGGYTSREGNISIAGALETGLTLQETELRLSANADPYFRYDVALTGHSHDGTMEVAFEEAFVSTLAIPGIILRAGKFLVNFGKANLQHIHSRRFIDAPRPLGHVFGADHLLGTGVSIDYLAPLPFFTELNMQAVQPHWNYDSHAHERAHEEEESEHSPDPDKLLSYGLHLKTFFDLTDSISLELGASGLFNRTAEMAFQRAWGLDLTLKWVPVDASRYRSLEWLTEYMASGHKAPAKDGLYTGVRYQTAQRWWFQVRGALLDIRPEGATRTLRGDAMISFTPSERTAIRLQYAYENPTEANQDAHAGHHDHQNQAAQGEEAHEIFLQLVVSIGPHPAHAY
jgi:hypothetical protein